jgi:hypothetical protein
LFQICLEGWKAGEGPVCLLVHGAIENGKIFYSNKMQ